MEDADIPLAKPAPPKLKIATLLKPKKEATAVVPNKIAKTLVAIFLILVVIFS